MTTIAYKDGVLAGDSRITVDDLIVGNNIQKVFKTKDFLFGFSGDVGFGQAFVKWVESGMIDKYLPRNYSGEIKGDMVAILVDREGNVTEFECTEESGLHSIDRGRSNCLAYGTGSPIALGAMYAGVSSKKAVQIASMLDKNTGGIINTVSFNIDEQKNKSVKKQPTKKTTKKKIK